MIINSMKRHDLNGTWLMTMDGHTYGRQMFIEFENEQIVHYKVAEQSTNGTLERELLFKEKLSATKNELVNEDRIRLYRMGETHFIISETESKSEDTEFATDYVRIEPTMTYLTKEEIQKLKFKIVWNNEEFNFIFNQILDNETIQEINQRLGRKGSMMFLEEMNETYFGSIYDNDIRRTMMAIKEINPDKIILYGFPAKPYEVVSYKTIKT
ncbi:hypothetical protein D2U88_05675 [Flagellimonas aequoris]|uniref:Uncharacterized protein n=2 Tax=Flagellimonas aequoris TaxID=2306997 RepID=A0A418N9B1_9FLAO|nr:hypothetical protein D2U88_05675 [Allomuricauda aequoris]